MKFFHLAETREIEQIGHYPQTMRTKNEGFHVDAFNSERRVLKNSFPEFQLNYGLDLHPSSNNTDILDRSTIPFGFVVSQKLKKILENFVLPPYRFYPIDVFGTTNKYYWFHNITNISEFIDFNNTEIEVFNVIKQVVLETIQPSSFEEIVKMKREYVLKRGITIRYKSIVLNNDFPNYDLFQIDGAQYFTLINEKLKARLEEENITGMDINEYSKINVDSHSV